MKTLIAVAFCCASVNGAAQEFRLRLPEPSPIPWNDLLGPPPTYAPPPDRSLSDRIDRLERDARAREQEQRWREIEQQWRLEDQRRMDHDEMLRLQRRR